MSYLTFLKSLKKLFKLTLRFIKNILTKRPKLSLLIPFSTTDPLRQANFNWLLDYWKHELPDAEIIIGKSKSKIFCKAEALNDAVSRSRGKILAILDADAYLSGEILDQCADRIMEEKKNHLWYVPYRRLYRLTREVTERITSSKPIDPYRLPDPIPDLFIENSGHSIHYGHRYGAMLMMFPREAYRVLGRFDERFKGWGGEDVCLLRALDTLYGKHKTINANIYHLWHPFLGANYETRRWAGQSNGGSNWTISKQYSKAIGNPSMMKKIVEDGYKSNK